MRLLEGVTGLESIGGVCPVQGAGWYADGVAWYFWARYCEWTLAVSGEFDSNSRGDPEYVANGDVFYVAGEDPTGGYMGYFEDQSAARRLVAAALCRAKAIAELTVADASVSGLIFGGTDSRMVLADYAEENELHNLAACCRAGLSAMDLHRPPGYGSALPAIDVPLAQQA